MHNYFRNSPLRNWIGIVFIILSFAASPSIDAAYLHAILVADTLDASIGSSTAVDLENVKKEVQKISHYTGLHLKISILNGKASVPEKVLQRIKGLKIRTDDVVFFYFSGHGYRTNGKGDSPWPYLYFSTVNKGIDYELIGQTIEARHPRLFIMMADSCNSYIPDEYAPVLVRKSAAAFNTDEVLKANYRTLFLDAKGVVMVTSSKAGEVSWGTNQGGLFTLAFLQNLALAVGSSEEPSWFHILEKASNQVELDQHPEYRIFLD